MAEVKIICATCGKEFSVPYKDRHGRKYCSRECYAKAQRAKPNVTCTYCGKEFHMKPYQLKSCKRNCGVFCSMECLGKYKKTWFAGENNHQYGLKGHLNSSFKGEETTKKNNGVVDVRVYVPDHPFADRSGRVSKHRLLVEQYADRFDQECFDEINGARYLKKEFEVHHKNMNHDDNRIENLEPVTKSEHTRIHNAYRRIVRGMNGRIVGVVEHLPVLVNIKRLSEDAMIPQKSHEHDAAYDVYAPCDIEIHKGRNIEPLGFAVEMPSGYAAFIRSRSGFAAKGIEDSDGQRRDADVLTGLIDAPYRGEVGVVIRSEEDFVIRKGTRIAQMQFIQVPDIEFVETDELTETDRGLGGFGHTGR